VFELMRFIRHVRVGGKPLYGLLNGKSIFISVYIYLLYQVINI